MAEQKYPKLLKITITKEWVYDVANSAEKELQNATNELQHPKNEEIKYITMHKHNTEIPVVEDAWQDVGEEEIVVDEVLEHPENKIDKRKKPKPFVKCPHCKKETQGLTNHQVKAYKGWSGMAKIGYPENDER